MSKKDIDWDSVQYTNWEDWERIFMFTPKRDINRKFIFGRAWKRERYGSVLGEHNPKTNVTPIHSVLERAYAKRKDVFIMKLKDTMQ